jgi:hypothetical protein
MRCLCCELYFLRRCKQKLCFLPIWEVTFSLFIMLIYSELLYFPIIYVFYVIFSSTKLATAQSSCTCLPGHFLGPSGSTVTQACTKCPAGSFSSYDGSSSCSLCPVGTSSSAIGATSSSTCVNCAIGMFSDKLGSGSCTNCPVGSFASTTGSSQCTPISCSSMGYSGTSGSWCVIS